jgi:hypothetical protein
MSLRYHLQVEYGPRKRVVIFKPDELNKPDEQKTFFTSVEFGEIQDNADFLQPDDLIVEDGRVGVDLNRLQERFGCTDLDQLIMPADLFRQFLEKYKQDD